MRSRPLLLLVGTALLAGLAVIACRDSDNTSGPSGSSGGTSGGGGTSSSGGGSGGLPVEAGTTEQLRACGSAPVRTEPFSKAALLGAAADCGAWHSCQFYNAALTLRDAVKAHVAAPDLPAAQVAWKGAMNAWQAHELFQFGPTGSRAIDKYHGRGLRSFVHPWPSLSRCEVETQVTLRDYESERGFELVLPGARGLYAIEYGLFFPGTDTACLPNSRAAQTWATLDTAAITKGKNDYSLAVAENVLAVARELEASWSPSGENFKAKLLAHDGYGSDQETLNVVAWSLMYAEKEVKDLKLGSLAGVQASPHNPETPFAAVEVENVRTNIRAFRRLFQGCGDDGAGLGFDDWLVAANHSALADQMLAALARFQTAADAFPSYADATPAQFEQLYADIKPLSDLLKTSFFGSSSPLNLKLPASAASDTD